MAAAAQRQRTISCCKRSWTPASRSSISSLLLSKPPVPSGCPQAYRSYLASCCCDSMYFRSALEIHIMSLGANKVCIFPRVRGSWCGPQASFWSLSCLKPAFPRAEKAPETHTLRSHQAGAGRTPGGPFASSDLSTDLQGSGATQGRAHPGGQTGPLCPTEWPDSISSIQKLSLLAFQVPSRWWTSDTRTH